MECDSEKHAIFILEKKSKYKNQESRPIGNFISLFPPSFSSNSFIAFLKTIEIKLKYWLLAGFDSWVVQQLWNTIFSYWYNCMNYIPTNLAWLCCNRKYHLALYSLIGKKLVLLFPAGLKTFIIYFQFSLWVVGKNWCGCIIA